MSMASLSLLLHITLDPSTTLQDISTVQCRWPLSQATLLLVHIVLNISKIEKKNELSSLDRCHSFLSRCLNPLLKDDVDLLALFVKRTVLNEALHINIRWAIVHTLFLDCSFGPFDMQRFLLDPLLSLWSDAGWIKNASVDSILGKPSS